MDRDCDAPRNGGSKDEQRPLTRDNKFCNSSFLDSGKLFRILAQVIALNSAEFTRVLPGPGLYPSRRNSGHRAIVIRHTCLRAPECAGVCPSWAQIWAQTHLRENSVTGNCLK